MKKLLACALIFVMCLGSLAACGKEQTADPTPTTAPTTAPTQAPVEDTVSDLVNAKNYLFTMYKDQTEATPVDYTVVGVVNIGGVLFPIEWTVDNASVKIIPGDDKMVTIDVDDKNPEEVTYVLTATLKDDKGNTESCSFTHRVPAAIILDAGMSYADIVDAAYTLEDGLAMEGTFRLYGTITKVDTPWSPDYKNITVTIAVAGKEDKPIMCYRLKGDGAENLKVGDAITVEGTFKNYKGTIEYDAGCVLVGYGEHKDYTALLDAAYTLEDGLAMQEPCTMSGVITKIDTPWSADYKNITVTMVVNGVEDKPIMCYRLQGEGAEGLAIGDYITVTGTIKNYKGTIEFDAKCNLDNVVKAAGSDEPVEEKPQVDPTGMSAAEILDAAYGLEAGEAFATTCTLTGVISEINSAWSDQYGNITVTIVVDGKEDKKIECFRLVGDGAADLAVGDTITVTGLIKNYNGKVEFDAKCNLDAVVKGEAASSDLVINFVELTAGGYGYNATVNGDAVDVTIASQYQEIQYVLPEAVDLAAYTTLIVDVTSNAQLDIKLVDPNAELNQYSQLAPFKDNYTAEGQAITEPVYIDLAEFADKDLSQINFMAMGNDTAFTIKNITFVKAGADVPAEPTEGPEEPAIPTVDYSAMTPAEILDAAYALADGEAFAEACTLTGVISEINSEWSEQYGNITVTIVVDGKEDKKIECFRLVGDGAATLAVGDTITVTGIMKNYKGKIEFDAKCNLDAVVKGEAPAAAEKIELNANDVAAGAIETATTVGGFTIVGTADAAVTVDSNSKKSDSGLEFTQRIKLGGSGSLEYRHISFTTAGAAKVTIYAMSSSSSEDRPLLLLNAEGTELGRGTTLGKVDESTIPVITFDVTEAGTYYLLSEKSGINVYYISVE
ncbi:MAG: hypothetical protein IJ420_06275 [Lachnospiraceae bacterium]|nr:hypothetical protein [Lachnospiraceae bacterium]